MDETIASYKLDKTFTSYLCIGMSVVTLLMVNVESYLRHDFLTPAIYLLSKEVLVPACVIGILVSIPIFLDNKVALRLTKSQLISTSNYVGKVTTSWSNIESLDIVENRYVVIRLRDSVEGEGGDVHSQIRLKLGLLSGKAGIICKQIVVSWEENR